MKKIKIMLLMIICFLLFPLIAQAEIKDYFNADDNISSIGEVNHNYFEAGSVINNNIKVNGLLFSAGDTVNINGSSKYAFIAGNNIKINGQIDKDLFVAGNKISVSKDSLINRDLYIAGKDININNNITGNVFISGSNVTLNNIIINGDVIINAKKITLLGNTIINGTLKYNENTDFKGSNNLSITNVKTYGSSNINFDFNKNDFTVVNFFYTIFSMMILMFVINLIFPNLYKKLIDKDYEVGSMFKNIVFGFLFLISVPFIFILSLITILGIPLGFLLITFYIILLCVSATISSVYLTNVLIKKLFNKTLNSYLVIAIGIVLLKLIGLIPGIGWSLCFILTLYGIGIVYLNIKEKRAK